MRKIYILIAFIFSVHCFGQQYFNGSTFGGSGLDNVLQSATDSQGNLYTVGLFQSTMTVGSRTIVTHGGNADGFLAKHDSDGNPIWVRGFGGAADDVVVDIAIDTNDNIYLTGYFQGAGVNSFDANPESADDDGDPSTFNSDEFWLAQQSAALSRDCFIIKLDSLGEFVWAKQVSNPDGGAANEDSNKIEIDSAGNVYVAGSFIYADFDPDPAIQHVLFANNNGNNDTDGFLLKLDSNGAFVWVKTFASTSHAKVIDMEFDASNNLYMVGRFLGTIDLDPSISGTTNFTSNGGYDAFMIKLNANGDYVWGNSFGSPNSEVPNVIRNLPSGIYVGGSFSGITDFDPSAGTNSLSPFGATDAYLSKFDTNGTFEYVYRLGSFSSSSVAEEIKDVQEVGGNLYATGSFLSSTDFDNGSGNATSSSTGGTDSFLLELSTSGVYQSHYAFGGVNNEKLGQLEINNNNQILLIGSFESGTIDLNPIAGTDSHSNSASGSTDVYISRFATNSLLGVNNYRFSETSLYPNPVKDFVFLESTTPINNYKLYSITGQLIRNGALLNNSLDLSNLSPGIYTLNLYNNKKIEVKKIIKQ